MASTGPDQPASARPTRHRRHTPLHAERREPCIVDRDRPWSDGPAVGKHGVDLARRVLDELARFMHLDGEDVRPARRGFDWWPHRLPVHVRIVGRHHGVDDVVTAKVSVPVVRELRIDPHEVDEIVDGHNRRATFGALVHDRANASLRLAVSAPISESRMQVVPLLAYAGAFCAAEAHAVADQLADDCAGEPAVARNAVGAPSPLLDVARAAGASARSAGFAEQVDPLMAAPAPGWLLAVGDRTRVVAHYAHRDDTSSAIVRDETTALATFDVAATHPRHGPGLRAELRLPGRYPDALRVAQRLNYSEDWSHTGFAQLGAWCTVDDDDDALVHVTFAPDLASPLVTFRELVHAAGLRSRWAWEQVVI